MKCLIKVVTITAICLAGITMFSSCNEDKGSEIVEPGTEPAGEPLYITFDKTEYYPFDVVIMQLPEAAKQPQYDGSIGGQAIKAQRIAESTLAVALPDLAAGTYTLSLQMEEVKVDGILNINIINILPLPTVSNPETIIKEIQTEFTKTVTEATDANSPNASLLTNLTTVFNEQLAQMSESEKRNLAAYWLTHPELNALSLNTDLRAQSGDKEALRAAIAKYQSEINSLSVYVFAFSAGLISLPGSTFLGATVCVIAAIQIIKTTDVLIDTTNEIVKQVFIINKEAGLIMRAEILSYFGRASTLPDFRSTTLYDYTLNSGDILNINVEATFRSITVQDTHDETSSEAKEIIAATDLFQTLYQKVSEGINTLRNYCRFVGSLNGKPQTVSEITEPLAEENQTVETFTVEIVRGNVRAQKQENNSYTFNTTAARDTDIEFAFKIVAEGIESETFSAVLKAEKEAPEITTTELDLGFEGGDVGFQLFGRGLVIGGRAETADCDRYFFFAEHQFVVGEFRFL